jgi:CheY-like chemotaxis protein
MAKILIIEDEQLHRTATTDRLVHEGYEVISASDGKEGFEMATLEKPDLIILDILMPVQDGKETLLKLKGLEETKNIPVIVLTAVSEDELADNECKQKLMLASEVLRKDETTLDLLSKKIRSYLKK